MLLLSNMSVFFFPLFFKPAANPFFFSSCQGFLFTCQRSKTASLMTHTVFAAEYERGRKQTQMKCGNVRQRQTANAAACCIQV